MHELLFHRQNALEDDDLQRYAADLALDPTRFDHDRFGAAVRQRVNRDIASARAKPRQPRRRHPAQGAEQVSAVCMHTDSITVTDLPSQIAGCEDCLATGGWWVHLRMCEVWGRICACARSGAAYGEVWGRIGCCDSSPNRHASAHARRAGHPIARSAEPGEDWSWCYLDNIAFVLPQP
jgi:hypothetical protein